MPTQTIFFKLRRDSLNLSSFSTAREHHDDAISMWY